MGDQSDAPAEGARTLTLSSLPVPAAGYAVRDGSTTLVAANRPFESTFPDSTPETPVADWLAGGAVTTDGMGAADLDAALADGEGVDVGVVFPRDAATGSPPNSRTEYRVRSTTTPASGADEDERPDGYLLVTSGPSVGSAAVEADRIATVISHDLRNPLDVAEARLQAARETGDPEHFDHLDRAHDRMERIIQDVLTLARGDGAITPSPGVDLERVVRDAWATVDTGPAVLDVDDGLPAVPADADRLQRLFENLFRNAVEHGTDATRGVSGDGSPPDDADPIRLTVGTVPDGFFVADDGRGVDPEHRQAVFRPGFTTDDTGAGLGLTIVERIATAHGWEVSLAESAAGGARFEFHGLTDD